VWVWELGSGKREVTTAQNAYQINGPEPGQKAIVFQNGYRYELNLKSVRSHPSVSGNRLPDQIRPAPVL